MGKDHKMTTPAATPIALDGGWAWMVLLGSFVAYFIADGWSYSFGVLYPSFLQEFLDTKGKTALIGALLYGMPLIVSPVVCALTNLYGCRVVAMSGGAILGLSFIISFFATSVDFLCVTTGFVASIGLAMTYIPALVIVTFYFEKRRGLATGLAVTGSGLGAFACPPLLELLIMHYSWRGTLLIFGAVCFNIIAAGALFRAPPMSRPEDDAEFWNIADMSNHVWLQQGIILPCMHQRRSQSSIRRSKSDMQIEEKGQALELEPLSLQHTTFQTPEEKALIVETRRICRLYSNVSISCPDLYSEAKLQTITESEPNIVVIDSPSVQNSSEDDRSCANLSNEIRLIVTSMLDKSLAKDWCYLVWCAATFVLYLWVGVPYVYLVDKAMLLEIDINDAVFLLSIIGIGRSIGQILLGYLGDLKWVSGTLVYAIAIMMCGLCTGLVPFIVSYAWLCVYCATFGFCVSVTYALQMMCVVDIVGLERSTNAFGLFQLFQGIATLLGTPVAGWLFDKTGDYNISFYCAGAWILFSGVILLPLPFMMRKRRQAGAGDA